MEQIVEVLSPFETSKLQLWQHFQTMELESYLDFEATERTTWCLLSYDFLEEPLSLIQYAHQLTHEYRAIKIMIENTPSTTNILILLQ